jgi:hypothetical protein
MARREADMAARREPNQGAAAQHRFVRNGYCAMRWLVFRDTGRRAH